MQELLVDETGRDNEIPIGLSLRGHKSPFKDTLGAGNQGRKRPISRVLERPYGILPAVDAAILREIEHYLATGESDPANFAWPGHVLERAERARQDLRGALFREVARRAEGRIHPPLPAVDAAKLARAKLAPMVRGLFPRAEREPALATLARSLVFVSASTLEALLFEAPFDKTAWDLANLYLASVRAENLGADEPEIVGLCEGHTCYVSPLYFTTTDPFADFVLHEVAHLFHHVKRRYAGLRETRTHEWLLEIAYAKRETFAYACEAYGRILEQATRSAERRELAFAYTSTVCALDERVDAAELGDLVTEACAARNGWRTILAHCAPTKATRALRVTPAPASGEPGRPGPR